MKRYTFQCTKTEITEVVVEDIAAPASANHLLVEMEIRIDGYSNSGYSVFTIEQFQVLRAALEKETENTFNIRYLAGLLGAYNQNLPELLIIDGCLYSDGGYEPHTNGKFLGYGGRKFKYQFLHADEPILTNNLWNGTELPPLIRQFMPDNAKWIKE